MQPFDTSSGEVNHRPHMAHGPCGFRLLSCAGESAVVAVAQIPDAMCGHGKLITSGLLVAVLDELMNRTARVYLGPGFTMSNMRVVFPSPLFNTGPLKGKGRVTDFGKQGEAAVEGIVFDHGHGIAARATSRWVRP